MKPSLRDLKLVVATLAAAGVAVALLAAAAIYVTIRHHPNHRLNDLRTVTRVALGQELLLRGYRPEVELRVKRTPVLRARFPVIDMNNHLNGTTLSAAELVQVMDTVGVARMVNLDGRWGDELRASVAKYQTPYPDRFVIFANSHFLGNKRWRAGTPDFEANVTALLRDAAAAGARGLKVWKSLGLQVADAAKQRVSVDDSRLDPLWRAARDSGLLLTFHVADPSAHFRPVDARNERWESLTQVDEVWLQPWLPPRYPTKERLFEEFEAFVGRYPDMPVIATHMAMAGEDLEFLGGMLDRHPNLYVDISTEVDEMGRQPFTARRFMLKYQDRVMFGTDGGAFWNSVEDAAGVYRDYFRFLETDDEYFDYPLRDQFVKGNWKIYGIALPDSVLEKIYSTNAARLLGGAPAKGRS